MNEEITISIKDLIYRMLCGWRKIIVFCIVFAVLGNCAGIYKDYKAVKYKEKMKNPDEKLEQMEENLATFEEGLTEVEISEAEYAVNTNVQLHERYQKWEDYRNDSILMQLECESVPTVILQYRVDTHYEIEYPVINKKDYTSDIMQEYITSTGMDDFVVKVAGVIGKDIKTSYVRELIDAYTVTGTTFSVRIISNDFSINEDIAQLIKAEMDNEKGRISNKYGEYDIELISEQKCLQVRSDIRGTQQSIDTNMASLRSSWMSLTSNMTEPQKKYYAALLDYEMAKQTAQSEITEVAEEIEEDEAVDEGPSYIKLKFIVLGFVLGGILYCGFIFAIYLIMPVLRVKENLTDSYNLFVYGSVWQNEEKKKGFGCIDIFLKKIFYGKEAFIAYGDRIKQLAAGIIIEAEKEGYKSIFIASASDKTESVKKDIIKALEKKLSVISGDSVVYDPAALEQLSKQDAVILLEMVGDSTYEDITKEVELSGKAKVPVIGAILVNR